MYPVSRVGNYVSSSIRNEYILIGAVGGGFAFGGWVGAVGAGATYFLGKTVCRSCQFPRAIQNIQTRLIGPSIEQVAYAKKDSLLKAVLKTDRIQNFASWSTLRTERDFLRRIPLGEWNSLLDKIRGLDREFLSLEVIDAFQLGKWNHPIFKHPEWPVLAFYVYLEGLLEEKYLPKLILFDACFRETSPTYGVRTFQLIDRKGDVNAEAFEIIQRGMKGYFSEQCVKALVEKLRGLPPEVSQFFQIQQPKESSDTFDVLTNTRFHPFLSEDTSGKNYIQTVLPPEFVHEILKVRFGQTTRSPNTVLGFFQKEKMSLVDRRVVALSLRDHVKLPPTLHSFRSTPLGYYQHDAIYHLFVDSANIHRPAWIEIAKFFKEEGEPGMAACIFDGDFPPYRSTIKAKPDAERFLGKSLEKDELFWGTLVDVALTRCQDTPDKAVDLFWDYLTLHSEEWNQNYGLSMDGLHQFLRNMSERVGPPDEHCLSLREPQHIMRLLAKKAGLQKEYKLWEGFPSFEARRQYEMAQSLKDRTFLDD